MRKLGWVASPYPSTPDHALEEAAFELADQLESDLANGRGNSSAQRQVGGNWITVTNSGGTVRVEVWRQVKFGQIDEVGVLQEEI